MTVDPFAPDVFTVDYIGTTTKVEFVVSEEYNQVQAVFTNKYDEPILGEDGQLRIDRPEYVSIGSSKEWQVVNGGTAFEHVSGDPNKRTRGQSAYFRLLKRATELVGREAMMTDSPAYNFGLHSDEAWIGKRWHWATEGAGELIKFKDRNTGTTVERISRGYQLPQEFLGSQDEQLVLTSTPYAVDNLGLDEVMLSDLTTMAKGYSLGEFQSAAVSFLRDLQDDPRRGILGEAIGNVSFYETLRNS